MLRQTLNSKSLLVSICLCAHFMCGCGKDRSSATAQGQNAPAHKIVQVNWRAELAATQKALEREPNSPFLHNQAAIEYDALGDFRNFEREIQTAIKLEPGNSMNYYMAYAVYKRRGLKEQQFSILEKALAVDPANPEGHYEKGWIFEEKQDWPDALREYETVWQLLQSIKSNQENLQRGRWSYRDAHGNWFDMTVELSDIADDIVRARKNLPTRR